ncbi:unnamed protein product [Polarella glacialis]|uniref:Calmodulin-lysine N-methyltransferase n=1 Tax=Polarella glacialis TaxID=89957 RepID=A0A813LUI6_POLGL|nr:unnamed protein product [Polarella glacialis]CAE8740170.1 unnamed protein product [Polarella glacialis]
MHHPPTDVRPSRYSFRLADNTNTNVEILEASSGFTETGFKVWVAAQHLCELLCRIPSVVSGQRVLELGAGSGLVSAVAATLGAHMTASDRPELLSHLRAVAAHGAATPRFAVVPLEWGSDSVPWPAGHFDVILGTDITYMNDCAPLLTVLSTLVGTSGAVVLLAHCVRSPEQAAGLWHTMRQRLGGVVWVYDGYDVLAACYDASRHDVQAQGVITFAYGAACPAKGTHLSASYELFREKPLLELSALVVKREERLPGMLGPFLREESDGS